MKSTKEIKESDVSLVACKHSDKSTTIIVRLNKAESNNMLKCIPSVKLKGE
jgi:hypothetical protein